MAGSGTPHTMLVVLRMFAVELDGMDVNPQFINPATLRFNGVVGEEWVCEKDVQMGITESRFSYTNGVRIEAFEDTVRFQQTGRDITPSDALSAELARRYAMGFDSDSWFAISLEFNGTVEMPARTASDDVMQWPAFAGDLVHEGVAPHFFTSAMYDHSDRRLAVDLFRNSDPSHMQLGYSGRVRRRLGNSNEKEEERSEPQLETVLSRWQVDWEDVAATVARLLKATLFPGDLS